MLLRGFEGLAATPRAYALCDIAKLMASNVRWVLRLTMHFRGRDA